MNAYERETNWRRQTHILMIFGLDSKEGKVGLLEPFQVCLTKWHVKGKRNIFTTRTHADVNKTSFFTWITNAPVNKLYVSYFWTYLQNVRLIVDGIFMICIYKFRLILESLNIFYQAIIFFLIIHNVFCKPCKGMLTSICWCCNTLPGIICCCCL